MNKIIFLSILILIGTCISGQIVQSSCIAPDSIISKYQSDADYLTVKKIYDQNLSYIDSIVIPKIHSDTILNALISVYNAVDLPARDTVVSMFDIHADPDFSLNEISIVAHPDLDWMQQLKDGVIPTGNSFLDSLLSLFQLSVHEFRILTAAIARVSLKTNQNLNLKPLADLFETMPGVDFSSGVGFATGGSPTQDIRAVIFPDFVELIYVQPVRYWKFNVYYDCTVEFVESYGNIISSTKENTPGNPIKFFPNPFIHQLAVEYSGNENATIILYDQLSRQVLQKTLNKSATIDTDYLPAGLYIYELKNEHGTIRIGKIVKQ